MSNQVALINKLPESITVESVSKLVAFLEKGRDAAVAELDAITTIESDEDAAAVNDTLATAKKLYDAMVVKRKGLTDPIKSAIEEIMAYENAINYSAKSENSYTRARAVLEEWNQKKINEANKVKAEAARQGEIIKYKAEFKAQVMQQLSNFVAGKHRTALDNMAEWEKKLTLENIDAKEQQLRNSQPSLKLEDYAKNFYRWGNRKDLMTPEQEDAYLEELKVELTFDVYNAKYQELLAPLKNTYLARMPEIRKSLASVAAADAANKERLQKEAMERIERQKQDDLGKARKAQEAEAQVIADQKDQGIMEGEFTTQAMTSDLDAGPSKKVFAFENDALWLTPFLQVVGKVAVSPKFKGIKAKDGYIAEIDKWLKAYSSMVGEPMKGLKVQDVAKTIVKKSKE